MQPKKFNVTVRRFDPTQGPQSGEEFILPVDCPDAEHAVSATLANLIAWTPKTETPPEGATLKPIAFLATKVEERK